MRRRRLLATLGVAATVAGPGCAAVGSPRADPDVGMTAVAFDPVRMTVGVGDEVVWENTSSRGHTVTAYGSAIPAAAEFFASGGYDSEAAAREAWREGIDGRLDTGDRFRHTFEEPGTYEYFCIPHEQGGMVGVVEVSE